MSTTAAVHHPAPRRDPWLVSKTFALAGISNMVSGVITHPIDVVKVRMQVDTGSGGIYQREYPGLLRGAAKVLRTEGPRVLFTAGLLPSMLREASYSTIRMGGYEPVKRLIHSGNDQGLPLHKKVFAGACSGVAGAFFTTPFDLAKVRLQTDLDRRLPNTFVLLYRIGKEGGLRGLWRGVGPNMGRGMSTTAAQIPAYDHSKHLLLDLGWFSEGPRLHFVSSIFAGFCVATANNPVDVVKSRMQSEVVAAGGRKKYRNIPQVVMLILRTEGPSGLYKGWFPNWARVGPHTCITFLLFEHLRRVFGVKPI